MTPKKFESIKKILSDTETDFLTVMAELYDQIFQNGLDITEREIIFVKVAEMLNRLEKPEKKFKYIFTAIIEDEQCQLGSEEVYAFIQKLRNLKAFYPKDLGEAAKHVFKLIDEQHEFKFVYFRTVFMCGFFPYHEDLWILFEEDQMNEISEASQRAINLMDRACWTLHNNDHLLLNYATHLIDSLHGDKVAQRDAIQQLICSMKQAGILMIQSAVHEARQIEKQPDPPLLSMPVQNQDKGLD